MANIKEQIIHFNRWQFDPSFRLEAGEKYRDLFFTLVENYLDKDISLSISGLRRVGKTTILFQLINHLLDRGVDRRRVFYFQFSEEAANLEKILSAFFSSFAADEAVRGEFYIFLDELQYAKKWQTTIKRYVDQNKRIKFIITGSASIYLWRQTRESLAGRLLDFRLDPLSFSEMLRLKNGYQEKYSAIQALKDGAAELEVFKKIQRERLPFENLFGNYLRFGEFPALLFHLDDFEYSRKYLKDGIIDKILLKDIRLFEVEKQEEIASLHKICCSNIAQTINLRNVSRETELSYPTIKKYLSVLKKTFLIESAKNRLKSVRSQSKSLDKIFSVSTNLAAATLSLDDPLNPPCLDFRGHIIENFIYNRVKKIGSVYYYRKAGKEIDFVVEAGNQIIPLEVKSAEVIKKTDANHLIAFMEKNNLRRGYLIYGGDPKIMEIGNKKIYLLPYRIF